MAKKEKGLTREKYLIPDQIKVLGQKTEERSKLDLMAGRTTWPRIWMMVHLGIASGLRVAEMANLKISDITFGHKPCLYVVGKGNKERTVELDKDLVKHIKSHVKDYDLGEDDYLLTSSHGKKYNTRGLQKCFKTACANAGLPGYLSIHSTRHSFGVLLYQKTLNLRAVQKQMGHEKPSTTAIYADVLPEEINDDMNDTFNGIFA